VSSEVSREQAPAWMDEIHEFLYPVLNELHGTHYSERFWKILVHKYVSTVLTRKEVFEQHEGAVDAPLYPVNKLFLSPREQRHVTITRFLRRIKHRGTLTRLSHFLREHNEISINATPYFNRETGSTILPFYSPVRPGKPRKEVRERLNRMAESQPNRFHRNILRLLPGIFVEHFQWFMDAIPLHAPGEKGFRVFTVAPGFQTFLLARYVEEGAKLDWYQHGGYYGEQAGHRAHHHESAVADRFHTWGWKVAENDVPDRAYKLEQFQQAYRAHTPPREYAALVVMPLANSDYKPHYEPLLKQLLPALLRDGVDESDLLIRARSRYQFFGNQSQLDFYGKNRFSFSPGKRPIVEEVRASKLVVHINLPSTTFLECVSVDHPCILIPDMSTYAPSALAEPFYEFFFEQGVFHRDVESAIAHVEAENTERWWKQVVEHPIYQEFKRTFCQTKSDV